MTEVLICRKAFGALYEDTPPATIGGVFFPGWYRVTVDGWFNREFSANSKEDAIRMFREGATA